MTWNGRKLMSYTKGDDVITYKYDGNGLRTSKTVNGVKHDYYYDENNQLIYEIKEGVYELYYKYDADGNLYSITRYRYSDGEKHVYYAVTNTRGDVIELRAASGGIYAKYTYDSWGKCISVKNSSGAACSVNTVAVQNSIRYRGYVYDHETGLYYLQSRYYDPETGRFLNADDAEYIGYSGEQLSYNAFAYCENNIINYIDINGTSPNTNKLTKVVSLIFSLLAYFVIVDAINNNYTYHTDSYSKGKVYIVDPIVQEYVSSSIAKVYVLDYRTDDDPNMKILSSYKITSRKHQNEIAKILLEYNDKNPVNPPWKRTQKSIVDEWRFHNLAYQMYFKRSRTADTDLNNNDEGKGFFDFIGR